MKMKEKTDCKICNDIPDKWDWNEQFDDKNSPEYKKIKEAIYKLENAADKYKVCPECRTYYFYEESYSSYESGSEWVIINLHRFTAACKKCGIQIISECGCIPMNKPNESLIKNKEINYTLCGEACRSGTKEKCIKCGTEFVISH
ncbi:hypothetical protein J4450_06910 [Candidatus Micrarchaeota archaeon]|nr:hypothetical protein [Candidatus Micrarchaeota archaeon]